MNKANFAYITGLIRTLESKLLNPNEMERMIDAKSFQDAYRVLNELDYSKYLDEIKSPQEFQKILDMDMLDTKKLLIRTCPYPWFLNIFWYRYDTHNIKTILKAKLMGKPYEKIEHLLLKLGNIPFSKLKKYIYDEQREELDPEEDALIKKVIAKGIRKFEEHQNPQEVDYIVDRLFFQLALKIAQKTGIPFIIDYVQHLIDLSNIKLFFRLGNWESESPDKLGLLAKGGKIPFNTFFLDEEGFLFELSKTEYKSIVETGLNEIKEKDQFIRLENNVENFIARYIRKRRFEAIGPEVVLNYYIAKKNNAMITRLILIGKMNNIAPEVIRDNVRTLYSNVS